MESLTKETIAQVSSFHKENPLQKGISKEELRKRIFDDLPLEVFRHCMEGLVERRKISFQEDTVSLHGREVQLTAEGEQVRQEIETVFQRAGYQPPLISDVQNSVKADPEEIRRIFFWMIKEKILVKVSEDLI